MKIKMRDEKCAACGHKLTINGSCRKCSGRAAAKKRFDKTESEPKQAPKELRDMTTSEACRAYGIQSCYNCDDESCGGKLNGIEPAADTIHASKPPKPEPELIKINEIDVCRQVINRHGISRQLAKAAEEFSEAAAAISRFLAGEGEYTEIIGEVADVEVMCLQMRLIYGVDGIEQARAEKVARLHGRLKP